jgi:hypothetical protein
LLNETLKEERKKERKKERVTVGKKKPDYR